MFIINTCHHVHDKRTATTQRPVHACMISSSPVSQHVREVGEVPCCIPPTVSRLQAGLIDEGLVVKTIRAYGVYHRGGGLGRSVTTPIKLLRASNLRK